jgi:hypothetical protein
MNSDVRYLLEIVSIKDSTNTRNVVADNMSCVLQYLANLRSIEWNITLVITKGNRSFKINRFNI